MNKKVRWGIMSTAIIAREAVIPAMQKPPYAKHAVIEAIASRSLEKAQAAAQQFGIPRAYGSYEELLADPNIDAVYIPLPNHMHVPYSIQALEAGKHVLCEKPISLTVAEGETLIAAGKRFPHLKLMEAFMYRHHPQWQWAKSVIADGKIGDLRTIQTFFSYYDDNPASIHNHPEWGGGGLMDIGCYPISLSRFLFDDEPQRVVGILEHSPQFNVDQLTSGMMEFAAGTATFTCSILLTEYQRMIAFGTKGRVEIEIPFNAPADRPCRAWLQVDDDIEQVEFPTCDQYGIQADLFSQAILNNTPVPTPIEDAVANMRVLEAIVRSGKNQSWETLAAEPNLVSAGEPLLQLIDVTRSFPGVTALDQVNFELHRGEVHALVGENGAGKSTLINILSGVLRPDAGRVVLEGSDVELHDPVTARGHGIVTVHQESDLFASLSVAENMALTQGLPVRAGGVVRWSQVYREAQAAVDSLNETIDIRRPAAQLSVAHRQMTQIAAAVHQQAKVVVLDEPTSALTSIETEWLFEQIAQLKAAGVGIIYISHRQEEIFQLSDRITVLRDGQHVFTGPTSTIDGPGLIEAMVGRKHPARAVTRSERAPTPDGTPPRLRLAKLTDHAGRFAEVDLDIHPGEIVGLYGLVGAGRSELAQAIFGLKPSAAGSIEIDGQAVRIHTLSDAVARSIAYVPEDRLREGVCRGLSVRENMVLSSLRRWSSGPLASAPKETTAAADQVTALGIKLRSVSQPIAQLSGGNQQKVVLARWLLTEPRVLLLDEPTRGVDVGAKAEIHQLVRRLAAQGCGVLMISSDLPEVLEHSDRIVVLRNGRVSAEFDPTETTANQVAAAALPDVAPDRDAGARRRGGPFRWRRIMGSEVGLVAAIAALAACLTLTTDQFLTASNFVGILSSAAVWIVLAMAAAVVIIAGGIDISIGALLALAAAAAGVVLQQEIDPRLAIPLAALAAMSVGALGGALNAAVALVGKIHPIVVTLGTMTIYRGLLITLTGGRAIGDLPPQFVRLFSTSIGGVPLGAWMAVLVAVAMHFFLGWTRSGRHFYAFGSSPSAARLVGISQRAAWLTAFCVGGLLAGVAGLFELAKIGSMQSTLGTGYELRAIAAAVIGGTAITGRRGSVFGVVLGALLLSLLYNALVLWNVSGFHYQLVVGVLILVAVLLDLGWRRSEA